MLYQQRLGFWMLLQMEALDLKEALQKKISGATKHEDSGDHEIQKNVFDHGPKF